MAAAGSKEIAVRVPKSGAQYGIMEFPNGMAIDVKDGNTVELRREFNPYTYRPATIVDPSAASSAANVITTSLGAVLPKTGAGSEYGREQKEALKRKRYATKGTNIEDLPWILTNRLSSEKRLKQYRGMKKGGITTNSSYYVFIQGKDGFEAYPVEDWYAFKPTNVYKIMDFDEAEKQYEDRHKTLSKWFSNHKVQKEKGAEDEADTEDGKATGKSSANSKKNDFKMFDTDEWNHGNDEDDDDDDNDNDDDKTNKTSKKKKNGKKSSKTTGMTLSDDDDDDETDRVDVKRKKSNPQKATEEQGEDSDNGDHDKDEVDYTSDETSDEEDDARDANTVKSSMKYEMKGIDEEMKAIPDIEKRLEQMDEQGEGFDFDDDDDEEAPDIDDNDEDNGKAAGAADDLTDMSKLLKNAAANKEIESSSDDDDSDDSDDPDKEAIEPIASSINTQPIPSEQIKTEKGHKKAKEEEMRAIKSKVMSLPPTPASASSNPSDAITEEKVRALLTQRHHMTFSELIQKFLPKTDQQRTKDVKDGIVHNLAIILKRLNIEEKIINGKKHIKLKT